MSARVRAAVSTVSTLSRPNLVCGAAADRTVSGHCKCSRQQVGQHRSVSRDQSAADTLTNANHQRTGLRVSGLWSAVILPLCGDGLSEIGNSLIV